MDLKKYLSPPVYADEEKALQAQTLHYLLLYLTLAVLAIGGIGVLFLFPVKEILGLTLIVATLFLATAFYLNHKGAVAIAAWLFFIVYWVTVTFLVSVSGGMLSLEIMFYLSGTVAVGLVLGARSAFFFAGLTSVMGLGMAVMDQANWVSLPTLFHFPPLSGWLLLTLCLTLIVIPLNITFKKISEALGVARREIRERQQVEAALRQSEEQYRLVSDVMSDYIFTTEQDAQGNLQSNWVTGAFEEITGYTLAEFAARGNWASIVHPEDLAQDAQDMARLAQNERVISEIRIIRKDGTVRWVRVYAHPVWDEARNRLGGIYGAVQDITERKQAEMALERERLLLRTVIDSLPDYIYLKDTDHRCLVSNLANAKVLGASSPAEVEGKTLFDFYPEEEVEKYNEQDKSIFAHGEPVLNQENSFIDLETGQRRWAWMTRTPFRGPDGRIEGVVGISRDITSFKEAQLERERLIAELERSNRELQDFAYISSHDLQEPLRKIQTLADRLQSKYLDALDEQGCNYLARMQESAARSQALIQDLLAYSRLATKARPFQRVDLTAVIENVLSELEMQIEETGARVKVGPLPQVEADAVQMRQLFQNLIGNGIKFHRPGVPPVVEIQTDPAADGVPGFCRITVSDNGIGFDEKYLDRIFTVFQRLHGADKYKGTGIGLAVCRRIVERHHGRITASSQPGQGSTFVVTLPVLPTAPKF